MWNNIPLDILSHIFSYLPPISIILAKSTCKHWHLTALPTLLSLHHPPWFLSIASRGITTTSYAYNPSTHHWHSLPLNFLPHPIRLIASLNSLLLCKLAANPNITLLLCNPFTKHYHLLPHLLIPRSTPAIGIVVHSGNNFSIYVAGGTSATGYESTVEVYDSRTGNWQAVGTMPAEYAVRLTVWTPNESVEAGGTVYWMTSARAYSVVAYCIASGAWREVRAPMAERLEWAALVKGYNDKVQIVGGVGEACWVWEMVHMENLCRWMEVAAVPAELGKRFWRSGVATKCVGSDEGVYLFRELGSEMLVWREGEKKKLEWSLVEGFSGGASGIPVRGALLHPSVGSTCIMCVGNN